MLLKTSTVAGFNKSKTGGSLPFTSTSTVIKSAGLLQDTFKTVDFNKISRIEKFFLGLAAKVPDNFFKGRFFHAISDTAEKYPAIFEAFTALAITSTIRPLTIIAVPGAHIEDKKYAATKSVISGVLGFAISLVTYKPIGKIVDKLGNGAYEGLTLPWPKDSNQFKAFSFLTNYGCKFIIGVPTAIILFKLIPVVMKKLFPSRAKKPMDAYTPPIYAVKLNDHHQKVYNQLVAYAANRKGAQS